MILEWARPFGAISLSAAAALVFVLSGCSKPSLGLRSEAVAREVVKATIEGRAPQCPDLIGPVDRNELPEPMRDDLRKGYSLYHSSTDLIGDGVYNVYVGIDSMQGKGFILKLQYDKQQDGFRLAGYSVPVSIPLPYGR